MLKKIDRKIVTYFNQNKGIGYLVGWLATIIMLASLISTLAMIAYCIMILNSSLKNIEPAPGQMLNYFLIVIASILVFIFSSYFVGRGFQSTKNGREVE